MRAPTLIAAIALFGLGCQGVIESPTDPTESVEAPSLVTQAVVVAGKCSVNNGGCSANATCATTSATQVRCTCKRGFTGDGKTCTDINECLRNNGGCGATAAATCTNTVGSRTCSCKTGYALRGNTCRDINECQTNHGGCSVNATCINRPGTVMCACRKGYTGDGTTCTDINECAANNGGCGVQVCTNVPGSRVCGCPAGYAIVNGACVDVNECLTNNGGCAANATCTNTPGSSSCACNPGYAGTGLVCNDINECATSNGGCNTNATCTNTPGSSSCACNAGYTGNGIICTAPTPDTTAPSVLSISGVPGTVDVSGGPQTVNLSASAQDNQSGVAKITLTLVSPTNLPLSCDIVPSVPGAPLSLSGSCGIAVAAYAEPGTYRLWAAVVDAAGNTQYYLDSDLTAIANLTTVNVITDASSGLPRLLSITGIPATVDLPGLTQPNAGFILAIEARGGTHVLTWVNFGLLDMYGNPTGDCQLYPPPPGDATNILSGTCASVYNYTTPGGLYYAHAEVYYDDIAQHRSYDAAGLVGIANRTDVTVYRVDNCAELNGGCDPIATCSNPDGRSRTCTCPAGYAGDGTYGYCYLP